MTEYLNVGKIVNTHGIRGEVRVISQTDFALERYQPGKMLMLFRENQAPLTLTIDTYRRHKNFDLLSFEGYPSINQVESFRDGILKVAKEDRVELSENGAGYVDKLREMGFLINCTAGNVLRFVPPLIITNEEIDKFVEALDKAL